MTFGLNMWSCVVQLYFVLSVQAFEGSSMAWFAKGDIVYDHPLHQRSAFRYRRLGIVNKYVIERYIGRGDSTQAYKARQEPYGGRFNTVCLNVRRNLLLKVMPMGVYLNSPKLANAFDNMFDLGLVLRDIEPLVVHLYDSFQDENYLYSVVEYCGFGSVKKYLTNKSGKLSLESEERIKQYIKGMAEVLLALKMKSVVHGDINMNNFYFCHNLEVKLGEWGYAEMVPSSNPIRSGFPGKPQYQAPESFNGGEFGFAADIWSLGIIMYVLFSGGRFPYWGSLSAEVQESIEKAPKLSITDCKDISESAFDLLTRMLTVDPSKRISVEDVVDHYWFEKM